MIQNILKLLRDRPILGIILCVILSEIIQLVITLVSKKPPAFHYGIAVMALLALFVIPVVLYVIERRNKNNKAEEQETEEQESEKTE